ELGGEGDADGGAGAEEVAEGAGWDAELLVTGDGGYLGTGGAIETEDGGVAEIVDGSRKRGDIADVIVAGILTVEKIEEFGEGAELKTFGEINVTADAEIDLIEGSAAELIERSLHTVHYSAIVAGKAVVQDVGGSGNSEGASAFELRNG